MFFFSLTERKRCIQSCETFIQYFFLPHLSEWVSEWVCGYVSIYLYIFISFQINIDCIVIRWTIKHQEFIHILNITEMLYSRKDISSYSSFSLSHIYHRRYINIRCMRKFCLLFWEQEGGREVEKGEEGSQSDQIFFL
jgi:hypothetical protein